MTWELCESQGVDPSEAYTARRWLERAMAALKPDERALIVLFELEGWSIAELAALQRRPVGTIKARLARARNKMRQAIEQHLPIESTQAVAEGTGATYALSQCERPRE